jgi:hypothetical protein
MRRGILAAVAATVALVLLATVALAQDDGGPAVFFPQTRYKFSPVLDGDKVVHEFVIQNKGTRMLNVRRVKTA